MRELSTGAVAALTARTLHPAATVYAIGYSGGCSWLSPSDGRPDRSCERWHDFTAEREMLRRAGVIFSTGVRFGPVGFAQPRRQRIRG